LVPMEMVKERDKIYLLELVLLELLVEVINK